MTLARLCKGLAAYNVSYFIHYLFIQTLQVQNITTLPSYVYLMLLHPRIGSSRSTLQIQPRQPLRVKHKITIYQLIKSTLAFLKQDAPVYNVSCSTGRRGDTELHGSHFTGLRKPLDQIYQLWRRDITSPLPDSGILRYSDRSARDRLWDQGDCNEVEYAGLGIIVLHFWMLHSWAMTNLTGHLEVKIRLNLFFKVLIFRSMRSLSVLTFNRLDELDS